MKILVPATNEVRDLSVTLASNCNVLDSIPKPGYWSSSDTEKANVNWTRAKDFLKALRAAQERIEHTTTTLQALLVELDSFVDQCRALDASHRKTLKQIFSRSVISFAPPPRIENDWLFDAIKERLTTRMRYIEQFMAEIRNYNNIVREIHYYHDINLHKPFIGPAYIEGFPSKDYLPTEIRIQ